jgi:predicted nucleic acid-binding protein
MTRYVLDTHLYIDATRRPEANRELVAFFTRHTPRIHLHSVVAGELLAGATSRGLERRTRAAFLAPLEAVGRVVTPSHEAWKRAGRILEELVRKGVLSPGGFGRSFFNDCLIAASAREHGFTLITANTADFRRIAAVEPLSFLGPWPDGQE